MAGRTPAARQLTAVAADREMVRKLASKKGLEAIWRIRQAKPGASIIGPPEFLAENRFRDLCDTMQYPVALVQCPVNNFTREFG